MKALVLTNWKFMTKVKEKRSKIRASRSWYQMKGLARSNTHVKYENHSTNKLKVISGAQTKLELQSNEDVDNFVRILRMIFQIYTSWEILMLMENVSLDCNSRLELCCVCQSYVDIWFLGGVLCRLCWLAGNTLKTDCSTNKFYMYSRINCMIRKTKSSFTPIRK
jgi:hypothetical protein